jgi:competence protein ComEA
MDTMHDFPLSRRAGLLVGLALLVVLVVAGRWAGRAPPPPAPAAAPVVSAPAGAAARRAVVVHVVGAVRRPGLYRLPEGSRNADAVARAGGATRAADLSLVNLAAPVADGIQVVVPRRGVAAGGGSGAGAAAGGPVSLSSATLEQLDALPGIGPTTAQRILDFRAQHGAFRSVDELDAVPGFGPARVEQLRELVTP